MDVEIKPCPFCGAEPKLDVYGNGHHYQVSCPSCKCIHIGVFYSYGTDAINAWNKRV